jgi:hypothetical protein
MFVKVIIKKKAKNAVVRIALNKYARSPFNISSTQNTLVGSFTQPDDDNNPVQRHTCSQWRPHICAETCTL